MAKLTRVSMPGAGGVDSVYLSVPEFVVLGPEYQFGINFEGSSLVYKFETAERNPSGWRLRASYREIKALLAENRKTPYICLFDNKGGDKLLFKQRLEIDGSLL